MLIVGLVASLSALSTPFSFLLASLPPPLSPPPLPFAWLMDMQSKWDEASNTVTELMVFSDSSSSWLVSTAGA